MITIFFIIVSIAILDIRNSNDYSWVNNPLPQSNYDSDSPREFSQDPLLGAFFLLVVIAFLISPILGVIAVLITLKWYRSIKIKVQGKDKDATKRRKEALLRAKVFLLPYKDIWRNLTLSNKYCSLKLRLDGTTIIGTEKKHNPYQPYRTFKIISSHVLDINELWNVFCMHFSYNKSYQGLLEDCNTFKASIYEDIITPRIPQDNKVKLEPKIDINNCSEAELTSLPGVSIVISKKIIKKREEIGGFKNVEDFLLFVNLKPNVSKQLESKICVNKMKGSLKITRSAERQIDL